MKIDLCIVNFNSSTYLARLLSHLKDSEEADVKYSIYIQDNGSEDESSTLIENWQDEHLAGYTLSDNVGYAAACNDLASLGNGEIIALLNADVWFTKKDLAHIAAAFERDPDIHILGPKQRDERGYITAGGIFGTLEAPKHRGWKEYDPQDMLYRDLRPAVTIAGSAYFIRREVWDELTECDVYKRLEVCQSSGVPLGAFLPTPHYY